VVDEPQPVSTAKTTAIPAMTSCLVILQPIVVCAAAIPVLYPTLCQVQPPVIWKA
jgi:hypothetical protein